MVLGEIAVSRASGLGGVRESSGGPEGGRQALVYGDRGAKRPREGSPVTQERLRAPPAGGARLGKVRLGRHRAVLCCLLCCDINSLVAWDIKVAWNLDSGGPAPW